MELQAKQMKDQQIRQKQENFQAPKKVTTEMPENSQELKRGFKNRHITMLALGGAIGAGLFKGSSNAIRTTGPSIVLSYLVGGIVLLFILQGMAELIARNPKANGFSDLVSPFCGNFSGYLINWAYFKMWFLDIVAGSVAAATFIQLWFPKVPIWSIVLCIAIVMMLINLLSVRLFAEVEYGLALLKISVIIIFIFTGIFLISSHLNNGEPVFTNLTAHGGFFVNGVSGFLSSLLIVIYSFAGSELIGMTIGEVEKPEVVIPKTIKGIIFRIISFYVIPFFIFVVLIPWNQVGDVSPFILIFKMAHIPYAVDIVNFIIILALLSSVNSGIYSASRILYIQGKNNQKQKGISQYLTRLNKHSIPYFAVIMATLSLFLGVGLSFFVGATLFEYLMQSISYTILVIWATLAWAHLKSRKGKTIDPKVYHAKCYPYTTWFALLFLLFVFVGIFISTTPTVTILTFAIYAFLALYYYRHYYKGLTK